MLTCYLAQNDWQVFKKKKNLDGLKWVSEIIDELSVGKPFLLLYIYIPNHILRQKKKRKKRKGGKKTSFNFFFKKFDWMSNSLFLCSWCECADTDFFFWTKPGCVLKLCWNLLCCPSWSIVTIYDENQTKARVGGGAGRGRNSCNDLVWIMDCDYHCLLCRKWRLSRAWKFAFVAQQKLVDNSRWGGTVFLKRQCIWESGDSGGLSSLSKVRWNGMLELIQTGYSSMTSQEQSWDG